MIALPFITRRFGRICAPGVYFPGQTPPAGVKLAVPSTAEVPACRLKKSALAGTDGRSSGDIRRKREAILESFKRLKLGRLVAEEQGVTLSYVYKVRELDARSRRNCR